MKRHSEVFDQKTNSLYYKSKSKLGKLTKNEKRFQKNVNKEVGKEKSKLDWKTSRLLSRKRFAVNFMGFSRTGCVFWTRVCFLKQGVFLEPGCVFWTRVCFSWTRVCFLKQGVFFLNQGVFFEPGCFSKTEFLDMSALQKVLIVKKWCRIPTGTYKKSSEKEMLLTEKTHAKVSVKWRTKNEAIHLNLKKWH